MKSITILFPFYNDGEKVVCVLLVRQQIRQCNQRIIDVLIVIMSHLLTMLIILNQILQFYIQYSSLNLIQTAVTSGILEHILLLRTIVCQSTNSYGQFRVIGSHSTTIPKRTKVLTRIERMTGSITNRTGNTAIGMLATMCLRVVLHKFKIVLFTKITNLIRISIPPIQMHNSNGPGLRSNQPFNQVIINLQRIGLRFAKYRHQPILCNSQNGGNIRIGWHNHLVTGLHYAHLDIGTKYPDKRIKPVGAPDAILRTYKLGIVPLKLLVLFSLKVPTSVHHAAHCLIYLCSMQSSHVFQT